MTFTTVLLTFSPSELEPSLLTTEPRVAFGGGGDGVRTPHTIGASLGFRLLTELTFSLPDGNTPNLGLALEPVKRGTSGSIL